MSEQLREALSAIVDGEASNFELRRVLDEISKEESLQTTWRNYHLMRSAMQGENTTNVAAMSDRIWAELDFDNDADVSGQPAAEVAAEVSEQPKRGWGVALGSGAIAAAVAAVLLVGGYLPGVDQGDAASQVAQDDGSATLVNPLITQGVAGDGVQNATYTNEIGQDADATFQQAVTQTVAEEDIDYGEGFISLADMTPQQRAHAEGRVIRHAQQRGMNNSNLMNFAKMITYQK